MKDDDQQWVAKVDKFSDFFDFEKNLGQGAFARVVLARDKKSHKQHAVKIIDKRSVKQNQKDLLCNEARILASLDHKNVIKFVEVIETETYIFIVMDHIKGGSLQELIQQHLNVLLLFSKYFPDINQKSCLLNALEYLHMKNIVHRDLKPENILIKDTENLSSIQIADFGLSTVFGENDLKSFRQLCGTLIYMAPEQLVSKFYSKPIDIWSVGIIMYKLMNHGIHPFYESGDTIQVYKHRLSKSLRQQLQDSLAENLCSKLLKVEPVERYTAAQALKHPWVTGEKDRDIPLTIYEMQIAFKNQHNVQKVFQYIFHIISVLKGQ